MYKTISIHILTTAFFLGVRFSGEVVDHRLKKNNRKKSEAGANRGGVGGFNPPPPPKFRRPSKIVPNSTRLWKVLKIAEFRTPTHQDVRKKGSKIVKLPSVCNCFTLATTTKLVVTINSLKVPKIKKIVLYEMKFLVPNYRCLQNPWLGGCRTPDRRSLCRLSWTEFVEPPEQNSWVRHWSEGRTSARWEAHYCAYKVWSNRATRSLWPKAFPVS